MANAESLNRTLFIPTGPKRRRYAKQVINNE